MGTGRGKLVFSCTERTPEGPAGNVPVASANTIPATFATARVFLPFSFLSLSPSVFPSFSRGAAESTEASKYPSGSGKRNSEERFGYNGTDRRIRRLSPVRISSLTILQNYDDFVAIVV